MSDVLADWCGDPVSAFFFSHLQETGSLAPIAGSRVFNQVNCFFPLLYKAVPASYTCTSRLLDPICATFSRVNGDDSSTAGVLRRLNHRSLSNWTMRGHLAAQPTARITRLFQTFPRTTERFLFSLACALAVKTNCCHRKNANTCRMQNSAKLGLTGWACVY